MKKSSRLWFSVAFVLAGAGFLLPLWGLSALGVIVAALAGQWVFAVFLGILLDVANGAPTGHLQFLFFPFTIVALMTMLVRTIAQRYLLKKTPQERI